MRPNHPTRAPPLRDSCGRLCSNPQVAYSGSVQHTGSRGRRPGVQVIADYDEPIFYADGSTGGGTTATGTLHLLHGRLELRRLTAAVRGSDHPAAHLPALPPAGLRPTAAAGAGPSRATTGRSRSPPPPLNASRRSEQPTHRTALVEIEVIADGSAGSPRHVMMSPHT